jgi:hypothetical protein
MSIRKGVTGGSFQAPAMVVVVVVAAVTGTAAEEREEEEDGAEEREEEAEVFELGSEMGDEEEGDEGAAAVAAALAVGFLARVDWRLGWAGGSSSLRFLALGPSESRESEERDEAARSLGFRFREAWAGAGSGGLLALVSSCGGNRRLTLWWGRGGEERREGRRGG